MATPHNDKLAVLIDADNAQASIINELMAEVSRYGSATVKRTYGDWTTPNLRGWKDVLHKLAIQPMQQFSCTTGKNATDSSLIIDAMDLLHLGAVTARDSGWAALSAVGSMVMTNHLAFDPRNYGCQKLRELVRKQPYLQIKEVPVQDGSSNLHLFVRLRV